METVNIKGHEQARQDWQDHFTGHHLNKTKWKRLHHSWVFWLFFILTLTAIGYYVVSVDFAFAPRKESPSHTEKTITP